MFSFRYTLFRDITIESHSDMKTQYFNINSNENFRLTIKMVKHVKELRFIQMPIQITYKFSAVYISQLGNLGDMVGGDKIR